MERRARLTKFHPRRTLLSGRNHTGKSTIIKNLFEALGAHPQGELQRWDSDAASAVDFSVDGTSYRALSHGGLRALFQKDGGLIVATGSHNEWAAAFAAVTSFNLVLTDKNSNAIPTAKTEAGKRTLRVPDVMRPHLQRLAADQKPDALLFGQHWRDWPREWVQRICEKAGVPKVTAHGMRGLHSTLAMEAGVTGAVVAASLGHEHVSTTIESYAKPEAVAVAQQRRALRVLAGGAG
jgi:hypothetical protein